MAFSEAIKMNVQKSANFTCCWCLKREQKVEVRYITPQAEGGSDTEENAAPLCDSCHELFGGKPALRKQVRQRRDRWYELCAVKPELPTMSWTDGVDVPLLRYYREIPPLYEGCKQGIRLSDKAPDGRDGSPVLCLSVHFKNSRYSDTLQSNEKWLCIRADIRFAFSLRVQVRAWNARDVLELVSTLRGGREGWNLQGPGVVSQEQDALSGRDCFSISRKQGENHLEISTPTNTLAIISVQARFSDEIAGAIADYFETVGFTSLADW